MHLLLFLHPVLWSHRLFNNFILSDPVCPHQLFSECLRAGEWLFALGCTLSTELIKAVVPKWEWYQNLNASIGLAGPVVGWVPHYSLMPRIRSVLKSLIPSMINNSDVCYSNDWSNLKTCLFSSAFTSHFNCGYRNIDMIVG